MLFHCSFSESLEILLCDVGVGIVWWVTDTNLDLDTRDLIILGLYVSCFIAIDWIFENTKDLFKFSSL